MNEAFTRVPSCCLPRVIGAWGWHMESPLWIFMGLSPFHPPILLWGYHWEGFDGARVASWRLLLTWLLWCWKVGPWGKAKEWNAGGFPIKGPPPGNKTNPWKRSARNVGEFQKGSQEIDVCSILGHWDSWSKRPRQLILPCTRFKVCGCCLGLFFMFSNFNRSYTHNETCVALTFLGWISVEFMFKIRHPLH